MLFIKKVGNRYYKEMRFDFRSLPIKRVEAEKMLSEGTAELIKNFTWERPEEEKQEETIQEKPKNVFDITARIEAKKEKESTQAAQIKFKNDYLPFLNKNDLETLLHSEENELGENIVKICMRIDLEKVLK
ncbi:MAG TPA: hypothetical protein VIK86_09305 [Candidatus Paceibacterota bacterium]